MKYLVNLDKAVKAELEKVVARGCVENEKERILIPTAALLCEFLLSRSVDREVMKRVHLLQRDMGFFYPPLTEAILEWMREGKAEMIAGIRALAAEVREL